MGLVQVAYSSGRDRDLRWRVEETLAERAKLLDLRSDLDANRSWLAFSVADDDLGERLLATLDFVIDRIDLTRHAGSFPRIGAIDDLRIIADVEVPSLAAEIAERYAVPVFLTGLSRNRLTEEDLEAARERGFGGLMAEMPAPDFGPDHVHPQWGVLPMGRWRFYLTCQVRIAESALNVAARLAEEVRQCVELENERFQGVRAMAYARAAFGDTVLHLEFHEPDLAPPDPVLKWVHVRSELMRRAVLGAEMVGAVRPQDLIATRLAPVRSKQVLWT